MGCSAEANSTGTAGEADGTPGEAGLQGTAGRSPRESYGPGRPGRGSRDRRFAVRARDAGGRPPTPTRSAWAWLPVLHLPHNHHVSLAVGVQGAAPFSRYKGYSFRGEGKEALLPRPLWQPDPHPGFGAPCPKHPHYRFRHLRNPTPPPAPAPRCLPVHGAQQASRPGRVAAPQLVGHPCRASPNVWAPTWRPRWSCGNRRRLCCSEEGPRPHRTKCVLGAGGWHQSPEALGGGLRGQTTSGGQVDRAQERLC